MTSRRLRSISRWSLGFTRSHLKNTMQARFCELGERENAGRKRAQVYPLRYSEHVFSRRRRDLVAQRAAAQGIFEMASSASFHQNSHNAPEGNFCWNLFHPSTSGKAPATVHGSVLGREFFGPEFFGPEVFCTGRFLDRKFFGPEGFRTNIAIVRSCSERRVCGRGDLNPQTLRHQILSLACLPIPPPPHEG